MQNQLHSVYTARIGVYQAEKNKIANKLGWISFCRLVLFLLFAWFMYSAIKDRFHHLDLAFAILVIPCFLFLVILASQLKSRNRFLEQLIKINENEIAIANGQPSFLDNGSAYVQENGFTVDLTIFGPHSLFHLIGRAGSKTGKEQLGKRLSKPFLGTKEILDAQACTNELSTKLDFRQKLLAHTVLLQEDEALPQLRSGINLADFSVLDSQTWHFLSIFWPAAGIILTLSCIWKNQYSSILAFGLVGLMILSRIFKKTNQLYHHLSKRTYLYNQYAVCFELICNEKFEHPYLVQKQAEIKRAAGAFTRLAKLSGVFDLRTSLFSFVFNGLFFFELHCAKAYLKWSKQNQPEINTWFDTLGEIELMNSLAGFQYNHPGFIFPEPIETALSIEATGMGHPLMNEEKAVVNDITIGQHEKLHLITGSNMSGKSTFLRTLGLNMLLAQSGAPVFADNFIFSPVQLLTSFHHIDSLAESTSYFYAELKSLQSIIQAVEKEIPSLVLLDEVMRGTNSKDKHDGTASLIKKLRQFPCLTLIATHDTELGILADTYPGDIENFCFESELTENGLTFDFKKKKGVAQTTNATYLMQQMGII